MRSSHLWSCGAAYCARTTTIRSGRRVRTRGSSPGRVEIVFGFVPVEITDGGIAKDQQLLCLGRRPAAARAVPAGGRPVLWPRLYDTFRHADPPCGDIPHRGVRRQCGSGSSTSRCSTTINVRSHERLRADTATAENRFRVSSTTSTSPSRAARTAACCSTCASTTYGGTI